MMIAARIEIAFAAYAAITSPLEYPTTADGKIPQLASKLTKAIWTAAHNV